MRTFRSTSPLRASRWMTAGCLAAAATLTLAACAKKTSTGSGNTPKTPPGVSINEALVPGLGTVVVNGSGRTLYALSSEAGGNITCTDANGCTAVWPDTELPSGVKAATAGPGVDASQLGTVKDAAGKSHVTFGGYPVYTYSGDASPGVATGQGIHSFGGTWETLSVSGTVMAPPAPSPAPSPSPAPVKSVVPPAVHTTTPAPVATHTTAPAPSPTAAPPSPQPTYNYGY
ncbi:MAG TPA: hypothetical protein VFW71_01280 [Actinomycetota bacterium]|nr:hypothetical protein [Actinomycetota bacterium]